MSLNNQNALTFVEHLEEFRKALIKCLVAITFSTILSLCFYPQLLQFFTQPYHEQGLANQSLIKQEVKTLEVFNSGSLPQQYQVNNQEHIQSLYLDKKKISETLSSITIPPKQSLVITVKQNHTSLNMLSPFEGISSILKIGLLSGLTLSTPFCLFILFSFIAPALSQKISKAFLPIFFFSCLNLAVGIYLGKSFCLPIAITTLKEINTPFGENIWSLSYYLDLGIYVTMGCAIFLELVLFMFLFVHFGKIDPEKLRKKRKHFAIFSLIIGALFTPPDVISQLAFAIPLVIVYELCYLYSKIKYRRMRKLASCH